MPRPFKVGDKVRRISNDGCSNHRRLPIGSVWTVAWTSDEIIRIAGDPIEGAIRDPAKFVKALLENAQDMEAMYA